MDMDPRFFTDICTYPLGPGYICIYIYLFIYRVNPTYVWVGGCVCMYICTCMCV